MSASPLAALNLSEDPNLEVRQTVRYVYEDGQRGILNLDAPSAPDPRLVSKVVEILKQGNPEQPGGGAALAGGAAQRFSLGAGSRSRSWPRCAVCWNKNRAPPTTPRC